MSRLRLRKVLILESKTDLEKNVSDIDLKEVKMLYDQADKLIPNIQKSFEDIVEFHNKMTKYKIEYITSELPSIENTLSHLSAELSELDEHILAQKPG